MLSCLLFVAAATAYVELYGQPVAKTAKDYARYRRRLLFPDLQFDSNISLPETTRNGKPRNL